MTMARILPSVPEEIFYHILLRLPQKSLRRFLFVSKSWCRLITTPDFISSHFTRNQNTEFNPHTLLRFYSYLHNTFCSRHPKEEFFFYHHQEINKNGIYKSLGVPSFATEPPPPTWLTAYNIIGSCNGLVCLVSESDIILWNPSIDKFVTLPSHRIHVGYSNVFGFGVDLLNGDFKVINVVMRPKSLPQLFEVYSLKTRKWKSVDFSGVFQSPFHFSRHQVYMNGCSHFLKLDSNEPKWRIVSFDMSDEIFREVLVPEQLGRQATRLVTMNLREKECLGIVVERMRSIGVWVMKEYGVLESWTHLYNIDTELVEERLQFVGFMTNDNVLMNGMKQSPVKDPKQGQLMTYDPHSELIYKLDMFGSKFYAVKYVESLVLLEQVAIFKH